MAYYNVCPKCGAHNDPGEKCCCTESKQLMVLDKYQMINKRGKLVMEDKNPLGGENTGNCVVQTYKFDF